jgi:hypothetical protein
MSARALGAHLYACLENDGRFIKLFTGFIPLRSKANPLGGNVCSPSGLIDSTGIEACLRCSFQRIHRSPDFLLRPRERFANVSFRYKPEILNRVGHGVAGTV